MKKYSKFKTISLGIAAFGIASLINCAPASADNILKPDNTGINRRDRNPGEMTADLQGPQKTDREITRQIRRSIVADKSLSTYAHNIKIITWNGAVTLKGPVKSATERKTVLDKASAIAGGKVTDKISITR